MIAANELRIGNWVNIKVEGKNGTFDGNYQIEEIRKDVILFNNGIHAAYRMLYPIPLTGERLLKCGFEDRILDIGISDLWLGYNSIFEVNIFIDDIAKGYVELSNNPRISLHQLQNLFFELTGKELEVKL